MLFIEHEKASVTWITLGSLVLLAFITLTSFISWYLCKQRQVKMNSQQNVCNDQMIQEMNPSYEQPTDCLPKICVTKIKQGKQIGIVIRTHTN